MQIFLTGDAWDIEATMTDRDSDKLFDVLELIAADVEAAKRDPRNRYVSSQEQWGTHIPGTHYSAFWFTNDMLRVTIIVDEHAVEY